MQYLLIESINCYKNILNFNPSHFLNYLIFYQGQTLYQFSFIHVPLFIKLKNNILYITYNNVIIIKLHLS